MEQSLADAKLANINVRVTHLQKARLAEAARRRGMSLTDQVLFLMESGEPSKSENMKIELFQAEEFVVGRSRAGEGTARPFWAVMLVLLLLALGLAALWVRKKGQDKKPPNAPPR